MYIFLGFLYYLEVNFDGKLFFNVLKMLKEVYWVLKFGGVFIIIMEILEIIDGIWFG